MTGQTIDQTYWIVASLSGFVYWAGYSDEYDRGQSYENSNGDLLFRTYYDDSIPEFNVILSIPVILAFSVLTAVINCKKGIKSKIPSSMLADDFSC